MPINKTLLVAITTLAAAGVLGAGFVRAQNASDDPAQDLKQTVAKHIGFKGRLKEMHVDHLAQQATDLGISVDDLKEALESDKPFYQIAAERGVTYDELQQKHADRVKERLNDMVKVGFMTQAQADEQFISWQERQDAMPFFGAHGMGPMGMAQEMMMGF